MNETLLLAFLAVFGDKAHHLTTGFATLFNLCLERRVFTESEFFTEKNKVESFPDLVKFRKLLEGLEETKKAADYEQILREYKGPVQ
jgi:hypothetical protein